MACKWIKAEEGYEWTPSELGKKDSRVCVKFTDNYHNKGQYQKKVPSIWYANGYVEQVKING